MENLYKQALFKNGRYYNYHNTNFESVGSAAGIFKEWIFGGQKRIPDKKLPRIKPDIKNFLIDEGLKLIWLGHSTVLVNIDGFIILTDPIFSRKVSFLGPTRYNGKIPLKTEELPDLDLVLISHNHYDHLDLNTIKTIHERTKQFIVPEGVGELLENSGVPKSKITELSWWHDNIIEGGLKIVSTPAQHFSGRTLHDRNKTLWSSWVIITEKHKLFFSGDSGYFDGIRTIGEKYGPFDITLMECGQYNERWHPIHMHPEETFKAHTELGGNILIPIHWGTFRLSFHDWNEPIHRLTKAAINSGVTVSTPVPGESVILDKHIPVSNWWKEK